MPLRRKRKLGLGLSLFGAVIWAAAVLVHLTPPGQHLGHPTMVALAIIVGGASVAGGIALIALNA